MTLCKQRILASTRVREAFVGARRNAVRLARRHVAEFKRVSVADPISKVPRVLGQVCREAACLPASFGCWRTALWQRSV